MQKEEDQALGRDNSIALELKNAMPILKRAAADLHATLRKIASNIEDRDLVRATIASKRIKSAASIERKAGENGWNIREALYNCGDLIGARVVCNNTVDVYRFCELLREEFDVGLGYFQIQDYVAVPDERGYRAIHVNFQLNQWIMDFVSQLIPCEVQLRTRLQDAWAELSRVDLYRKDDQEDAAGAEGAGYITNVPRSTTRCCNVSATRGLRHP